MPLGGKASLREKHKAHTSWGLPKMHKIYFVSTSSGATSTCDYGATCVSGDAGISSYSYCTNVIWDEPDMANQCVPGPATRGSRALNELNVESKIHGWYSIQQVE